MEYRFPIDHPMSPPSAQRQSAPAPTAPAAPANPWLPDDPERLARVMEMRRRTLKISEQPPDPVAHCIAQRNALERAAQERAVWQSIEEGLPSWQEAMASYAKQVSDHNTKTEAEKAALERAKRKQAERKQADLEARRVRKQAEIVASARETAAAIAAIKAEIAAILGGGL